MQPFRWRYSASAVDTPVQTYLMLLNFHEEKSKQKYNEKEWEYKWKKIQVENLIDWNVQVG